MNPLEVLNSKPTFNEFLAMRLREDSSYFSCLIQQNYMLGEVIIFCLNGGSPEERMAFFHQLADTHIEKVAAILSHSTSLSF